MNKKRVQHKFGRMRMGHEIEAGECQIQKKIECTNRMKKLDIIKMHPFQLVACQYF